MKTRSAGVAAVVALALSTMPLSAMAAPSPTPSPEVDAYVASLNYDATKVLARVGDQITTPPPTTGELAEGRYTVVSREKKQFSAGTGDLSAATAGAEAVYPGALVRVDSSLTEGRPTVLSAPRGKVTVSLDLPGMAGAQNAAVVSPATKSATRGAVSTLLERWNAEIAPKYPNVTARYTHDLTEAYSKTQIEAKLGLSLEAVADKLGIDFNAVHKGEKQTTVASFKQIYYTASVDDPTTPSAFLAAGASVDELRRQGASNETPPGYVSSVSYGRQIFVKMESESKSTNVKAAFKAVYQGQKIEPGTEVDQIVKSSTFKAAVIGGSAPGQIKVLTGKLGELNKVIEAESNYNRKNPGAPISYTVRFLKDNQQAVVSTTGDYIETNVTTHSSGKVTLAHTGGYVAKFALGWDEVSYSPEGKRVLTRKEWSGNNSHLTSGFSTTVPLPANATNVSVLASEQTGLAWEGWRTVVDERNLPLVPERKVSIWGTTLFPKGSNEVVLS